MSEVEDTTKLVKRGVIRQVVTKIPAREEIKEVEVDTLQEFLKEVELTERDLRVAVKAYKEDKVSQPSYKMDDVLKLIQDGKDKAEKFLSSDFKEKQITTRDVHVAEALIKSKKFRFLSKSNKVYTLERI